MALVRNPAQASRYIRLQTMALHTPQIAKERMQTRGIADSTQTERKHGEKKTLLISNRDKSLSTSPPNPNS